jgi:hypothetical protein
MMLHGSMLVVLGRRFPALEFHEVDFLLISCILRTTKPWLAAFICDFTLDYPPATPK